MHETIQSKNNLPHVYLAFYKERKRVENHQTPKPRKKLWATSNKHDLTSWLRLVTILWPRRLRCCNRYMITAINTSQSFQARVSKSARQITTYFYKSETQEPKWPLVILEVFKKLLPRLSMLSAKSLHLSEWHICIFCPLTISRFYASLIDG